jgi:hypothetical protein
MSELMINGMPVDERELSRADTIAGRLQRACLQLLSEHEHDGTIPTNGRFVYYELVQRSVIPKTYYRLDGSKRPRQGKDEIADALLHLREHGVIPWEWIRDENREVCSWRYARNAKQYLIETLPMIRIDCWGGELAPLAICESGASKGVLEDIASDYLVPITATKGQCGGFLVTDIVPLLADNDRRVLYIGDFELRGPADQIEANTRRYIEEHAQRKFTEETWTKIALTEAQVAADRALLKLKIDKLDRRYRPPKSYEAVECEAIGQARLQEIFKAALDALLPKPLLSVQARETRERAKIKRALRKLR